MKKTVTTLEDFRRSIAQLEADWDLVGHVEDTVSALGGIDMGDALALAHVLVFEAKPAPARGRGERVTVDVATGWNRPPFGTDAAPLAPLRQQVASWPGVEEVGPATVDTQLGALWGFAVTLRLSQ